VAQTILSAAPTFLSAQQGGLPGWKKRLKPASKETFMASEKQQPATTQLEKFPTEWAMGYEDELDSERQRWPPDDARPENRAERVLIP
jgi:hypothetical protein